MNHDLYKKVLGLITDKTMHTQFSHEYSKTQILSLLFGHNENDIYQKMLVHVFSEVITEFATLLIPFMRNNEMPNYEETGALIKTAFLAVMDTWNEPKKDNA